MTKKIEADTEIGKIKQCEVNMIDEELINKYLRTYDLSKDTRVYFTDRPKTDNGNATGVEFVIQA